MSLPSWYRYMAGIASYPYKVGVGIRLVLPHVPTKLVQGIRRVAHTRLVESLLPDQ
jgi:hypothetical protein